MQVVLILYSILLCKNKTHKIEPNKLEDRRPPHDDSYVFKKKKPSEFEKGSEESMKLFYVGMKDKSWRNNFVVHKIELSLSNRSSLKFTSFDEFPRSIIIILCTECIPSVLNEIIFCCMTPNTTSIQFWCM